MGRILMAFLCALGGLASALFAVLLLQAGHVWPAAIAFVLAAFFAQGLAVLTES